MRDFEKPGRSAVYATQGMCATSHPLAAQAAVGILQDGGNAVDAALAAAAALSFCEPHMCGLGGDCFVLLKPAGEERVIGLNGSGRAPAGMDAAALRDQGLTTIPLYGIEPVTLPGAIDAFCRLSVDWGRLGLDQVLAPAIRMAEEGVPIAPRVARDLAKIAHLKGAARNHYLKDDRPLRLGEIFRAPGQAEVLRRVAREGRAGYYEGEVAADLIDSLRALGGSHTLEDLAATACDYTDPVEGSYRGVDLIEHAPNGQGATAILLAGILSHFDLAAMDPFGAERLHLEAEATKLAYDARNRIIADPDHTTRLAHMLAPETAAKLAALIDPDRAMESATRLSGSVHRDTVLLTVVDRDRMAVSFIYSLFHGFGSGLASTRFGVPFQNRGAGFTLTEGHPNEAGPGKRPMHTIIPAMLREGGRITLPFGVMGGAYQATGHARLISNLVDDGMELQAALDAPRSFAAPGADGGDVLSLEAGHAPGVAEALAAKGHRVQPAADPIGGAQAIRIEASGVLVGASDPRKDGCAAGY
ncbi:gamma-glutamyltransferase family protein [Pararhodobacter sp. SW119]|uniref:gamma-glutamyltransferase family protein n=1 Tax=Pararhodobacter sp. SW119 TaxID=2780075 RepID=UPI001AE07F70|nr:gamma-glutamyltransferase family protein [Pararhodobacter sp. SW119]